jgi:hypothetical protein
MSRNAVLSLVAVFSLGSFAAANFANAEPVWKPSRHAAQQRYLACKEKLQKDPPCNQNWTGQCVKMCGGRYICADASYFAVTRA